ncbi:hypothetical protein ACFQ5M_04305 [Agrilactobacillus yilanensis]|uniref:NADH:flavin oxidoreductase/NADH oxidase N-terminal domain-containing protein n=1 Tax=Agrilactobacillus yilanensis TaxID=2485997 RepID=A0ABW4J4M0_9LACO|nr:flavin oxidoreductase/NADH oxidase [Agrilactobacillus yilanensis]
MNLEPFHYKTLSVVKEKREELNAYFPLSDKIDSIFQPISLYGKMLPNRLGIAPMEGNDSKEDGGPSEHTIQRYINYAKGGASIIWYEAVTVVPEGRSSKHQLMLTEETMPAFKMMNERVKKAGRINGFEPVIILQANHSGRYSNPNGYPEPLIAYHNDIYEKNNALDDSRIVSDDYLSELPDKFGEAARLAKTAGFDAIDVKSCHGYLYAEIMSAYRRAGRYGGSFENRSRLLIDSIKAANKYKDQDFHVTCRLGIYDGFPYPNGWCSDEDNNIVLDEAIQLTKILKEDLGLELLNIVMGNPYVNSHVSRPFDHGKYKAPEPPLVGISRIYKGTQTIKQAFPDLMVMASAPSYLRQFSPNLAAGALEQGYADFINFGRESFTNPNFPNELKLTGGLKLNHVCITCGKCGDLIRAGYPVGCVVRGPKEFKEYYKEFIENKSV